MGNPYRLGCRVAGWQRTAWLHLQPVSRGKQVGPWAGLGRAVGTASDRGLLVSLAVKAWRGSPGTSVQDSWVAHLEAEGRGRAPPW